MFPAPRPRHLLLTLCLAAALSIPATSLAAPSDSAEIQLQRALDNPIDFTLDKVELSKAFEAIAAKSKIALQVDQACYESLPYGSTTKVTATFRASPLRAAIEEILSPLGLEQAVSGPTVVIRPSPALARIGRRADWDELKLLQTLRTQQLPKLDVNWTEDLRTFLGKPQLLVEIEPLDAAAHDKAMAQVRALLPCTVAQALETYASAAGLIWTVQTVPAQSQKIVLESRRNWTARQLREPIVLDFTNAPLADVVADLAHLSRIRFQPEPGLYLAVPSVSLKSNNGTAQQTLDALSGATGIAYDIKDDGSVLLHLAGKPNPGVTPRSDLIIGRIPVPMGADNPPFDLYIHESDLPPELNDLRKKKLRETIENLQRALTAPAPPPTTAPAPATQPK